MYSKRNYKLSGAAPLLQHSARLADPKDPITKELKKITGKRAKTEADLEEMARLEWMGSLYLDNGVIVLPSDVMDAAIIMAAKKRKRGPAVKAGVFCSENFPLVYDGSNGHKPDLEKMWEAGEHRFTKSVRVQQSRVQRTRAKFENWSCEIAVTYNDELIDAKELDEIIDICGEQVGLCDWRPKYGRFTASVID